MRERMRPAALEDLRGQLLLEAVAEKEGIAVDDADVEKYLSEIAQMRNESPGRVRAEYARDGRLESIAHQLRQDKALEFLVARAVVTEGEPAPVGGSETGTEPAGTGEPATP